MDPMQEDFYAHIVQMVQEKSEKKEDAHDDDCNCGKCGESEYVPGDCVCDECVNGTQNPEHIENVQERDDEDMELDDDHWKEGCVDCSKKCGNGCEETGCSCWCPCACECSCVCVCHAYVELGKISSVCDDCLITEIQE